MSRLERQDLPGRRSGRTTSQFSPAQISNLIGAVELVCEQGRGKAKLVVRRKLTIGRFLKIPKKQKTIYINTFM